MADSAIDICSRALVLIGQTPITSFSAGDTPSVVANNLYEPTIRGILSQKRWGFARTTVQLSRKLAAPTGGYWEAAYSLPADLLQIHRVEVNALPIRYERFQSEIRCNTGTADEVYMTYIRRVDETELPPYFIAALELELAARFAFPITSQQELAGVMRRDANKAWIEARTAASQEQSAQRLPISRMMAVRRGRG
jgi:hypothetical protein